MNFLITGGTGFIGKYLSEVLISQGHQLIILSRKFHPNNNHNQKIAFIRSINELDPIKNHIDIIINLAGENLTDGRWTAHKKAELYHSRLETTQQIIDYIAKAATKPKLLISGSAIGFYGESLDQAFNEDSSPATTSLAHDLCQKWERTAEQAKAYGVRVCLLRTAIVLGKDGGALSKLLLPFSLGLGGILGEGTQWMSWIHIEDEIGLIEHIIKHEEISGAINLSAPNPVTNKEFTETLAAVLHRPAFFKLPAFFLKLVFGEMAELLLLQGQKVLPEKALDSGYVFKYPELRSALQNIIQK